MLGEPRKLGGEVDGVLAHHGVQLPVNLQAFSKSVDIVDVIDIEYVTKILWILLILNIKIILWILYLAAC